MHTTPKHHSLVLTLSTVAGLMLGLLTRTSVADDAINQAKSLSRAFRSAAQATTPSVVTIIAKQSVRNEEGMRELRNLLDDPRFRRLFPQGQIPEIPEEGDSEDPLFPGFNVNVGSGVIIDSSGVMPIPPAIRTECSASS